jgi:6-pyruvoyltetrahydropterin/6-carboxytetrahydropterin synthase
MRSIRISKEFTFEMAHALFMHDGKCSGVHGHSYHLTVTVIGEPIKEKTNPKNGMVMDYSNLKNIIKEKVIDIFDHAVVLNENDPLNKLLKGHPSVVIKTKYQPTCENLLLDFVQRISSAISLPLQLHSIRLRETNTSYAEWFKGDNE